MGEKTSNLHKKSALLHSNFLHNFFKIIIWNFGSVLLKFESGVRCSPREPHALAWGFHFKNLSGWADQTENWWKNYLFLVNLAPTDSLDTPYLQP